MPRLFLLLAALACTALALHLELLALTPSTRFTCIRAHPTVPGVIVLCEKGGTMRLATTSPFALTGELFGTITVNTAGERGLLDMVFDPMFNQTRLVYLHYTTPLVRLASVQTLESDPLTLNMSTLQMVYTRTASPNTNHNGGSLQFSPTDGMLYLSLGDGGGQDDPNKYGQNLTVQFAKILRFNVSSGTNYTVPTDNYYAGVSGAFPPTFAVGLRNAWRTSFDSVTGDMWIADVGQEEYEEITVLPSADPSVGHNLGWSCYEGYSCFSNTPECNNCNTFPADYDEPLFVYNHSVQIGGANPCAVTGGEVYRGSAIPQLYGSYIFTDYCAFQLQSIAYYATVPSSSRTLLSATTCDGASAPAFVTTFGLDSAGELYFGGSSGIYRLVANCSATTTTTAAAATTDSATTSTLAASTTTADTTTTAAADTTTSTTATTESNASTVTAATTGTSTSTASSTTSAAGVTTAATTAGGSTTTTAATTSAATTVSSTTGTGTPTYPGSQLTGVLNSVTITIRTSPESPLDLDLLMKAIQDAADAVGIDSADILVDQVTTSGNVETKIILAIVSTNAKEDARQLASNLEDEQNLENTCQPTRCDGASAKAGTTRASAASPLVAAALVVVAAALFVAA